MTDTTITIRRAEAPADYVALQDAQRRAWGLADDSYVVPVATMVGAQHHGGLVLGAFTTEGEAVGLSFAFLGRTGERWCLYSQLTGVVPGYQGRGIGARMKEVQREHARAIGVPLIAWSFDPLQAGNAHFNLARLGARSHSFIPNMYGVRTDALNAGVPTDRLIVAWSTTPRPRVAVDKARLEGLPQVIETVPRPDGLRDVAAVVTDRATGEDDVLLEIPGDIGRLRSHSPELADRWRGAVARGFTTHFASGYEAVDFLRIKPAETSRHFYVLRRETPPA